MKRLVLLYCGLICAMLAMADNNTASLWVGESHTFSVPIENKNTNTLIVYWEDMRWDYESEADGVYFAMDASESSSSDEQATATVSLTQFFTGTKHVIFHYTEVRKVKILWTWNETRKDYTKTFSINCNQVGITFNPSSINLQMGDKQNLQWTLSPTPPAGAPSATITFSSSNNDVATVDARGCVTGKSVGKATITAETNYATSASCVINVTPVLASSISIEPSSVSLSVGSNIQLRAVLPENTSDKSVTWASDNKNVATVDANGLVTAIKKGNATITAKTKDGSNLSAQCSIQVMQADANGDGIVDVSDVVLIIDMALGKITFD